MSFRLALQDALCQPQALARVGVVRAHFYPRQLRERNFFRGIMKQNQRQRVAGILSANQMRKRHGDFLGRSEPVLAIEDHRMRAIQHKHSGAGRLVLALMNLQIGILDVQRQLQAFALNGVGECGGDVEVQGVAEFVSSRSAAGLDSGRHVASVMAAEAGFAQRSHQIAQGLETEKVQALVGDFKLGLLGLAGLPANA